MTTKIDCHCLIGICSLLYSMSMTLSAAEGGNRGNLPYVYNITCADSVNPGKDASGKNNDATLTGDAMWVKDGDEGAIEFGGTGGHLEMTADVPERNFTMAI